MCFIQSTLTYMYVGILDTHRESSNSVIRNLSGHILSTTETTWSIEDLGRNGKSLAQAACKAQFN